MFPVGVRWSGLAIGALGGSVDSKGWDIRRGRVVAILQEAQSAVQLFRVIQDTSFNDGR